MILNIDLNKFYSKNDNYNLMQFLKRNSITKLTDYIKNYISILLNDYNNKFISPLFPEDKLILEDIYFEFKEKINNQYLPIIKLRFNTNHIDKQLYKKIYNIIFQHIKIVTNNYYRFYYGINNIINKLPLFKNFEIFDIEFYSKKLQYGNMFYNSNDCILNIQSIDFNRKNINQFNRLEIGFQIVISPFYIKDLEFIIKDSILKNILEQEYKNIDTYKLENIFTTIFTDIIKVNNYEKLFSIENTNIKNYQIKFAIIKQINSINMQYYIWLNIVYKNKFNIKQIQLDNFINLFIESNKNLYINLVTNSI